MNRYLIPAGNGESEYVEKRSSFLGHVRHIETEDEAREFIASVKKEHHDARHNCWCYIIRGGAERYSDDGEPQGTAGIPMLEVFRREGISDVVCVVTRYFGGVLLGAGGLLRAYTKAAKDSLDDAGIAEIRTWQGAEIRCPYSSMEKFKLETASFGGTVEQIDYGADVVLSVLIPEENYLPFADRIFDISAGSVKAEKTAQKLFPAKL